MFRLFLVSLLQSGDNLMQDSGEAEASAASERLRNRRIFERFGIDHKHLALMNDQDILPIRDISEKGFATEVSERGFRRLVVGDVYLCRIRYLGEVYESQAVVRWKASGFVGFELLCPSVKVQAFMKRLLLPVEVGASLKKVDDHLARQRDHEGMHWYQAMDGTQIYVWEDDAGTVRAWKVEKTGRFVRWDADHGLRTGSLLPEPTHEGSFTPPWEQKMKEDSSPDTELTQFVTDVLMAAQIDVRDQLIRLLVGDTR